MNSKEMAIRRKSGIKWASVFRLLTIILVMTHFTLAKEWNGIVPCVSTRSDVNRILGKDSFAVPDGLGHYRHENFRVTVYYDRKNKDDPYSNLVRKLDVYPDETISLSKYIKKVPNFHKNFLKTELDIKISHIYSAVYSNWEEGFEVWVQKNEKGREIIDRFGYFDPAWDCSKRKSGNR